MTQPVQDSHNALPCEVALSARNGDDWHPYDCVINPIEFIFTRPIDLGFHPNLLPVKYRSN